ncbi:MAG: hypothetical protein K0U98_00845 [Deltaproteobacteria bacterium]|nr:hypothetical protein [Deltaproteobacteria bacterium]
MKQLIDSLWASWWSHVMVANLRILLGFAFVSAGLSGYQEGDLSTLH